MSGHETAVADASEASPITVPRRVTQGPQRLHRRRRGTATVELALTLPVLLLVVMGAIEGAAMIFLKQSLVQAAYEGSKVATRRDATNADIVDATRSVLVSRVFDSVQVETIPFDITTVEPGQIITVRVSAPSNTNSLLPFGPFSNRIVAGSAVMVRE